jgi:hypothetical protein
MDKKFKSTDVNCSKYQQQILDLFDRHLSTDSDQALWNHLEVCPECTSYLNRLEVIRDRLKKSPKNKLQPDPRIKKNIIAYRTIKSGLKSTKPNYVWNSIREFFEYRIPVYQVLSGVMVILILFIYISNNMISSGNNDISIEYTGDYEGISSSQLYLKDTLSLNELERGENAKEDSVLMSFLVPTM